LPARPERILATRIRAGGELPPLFGRGRYLLNRPRRAAFAPVETELLPGLADRRVARSAASVLPLLADAGASPPCRRAVLRSLETDPRVFHRPIPPTGIVRGGCRPTPAQSPPTSRPMRPCSERIRDRSTAVPPR